MLHNYQQNESHNMNKCFVSCTTSAQFRQQYSTLWTAKQCKTKLTYCKSKGAFYAAINVFVENKFTV